MRKIKNILILAGGDGDRFWPLENKSLFSFFGVPLIIYLIKKLLDFGEKIYIVANKNNVSLIKRLIYNYGFSSFVSIFIQSSKIPGQAGAIESVKNFIKGEVLIINANDKIDFSVLGKIVFSDFEENKIILFGKKINEYEYFPGGYFKFNEKNEIEAIIEKPKKEEVPSNFVKLVLDYYSNFDILIKNLSFFKENSGDDIYEKTINKIIADNLIKKDFFSYEGEIISLKYSWNVLSMMKSYFNEIKPYISKKAKISKKSKIIGNVFIEEGSIIGDYVKIVGPVYIGKNSIIGDYTLIRESHIGDDCLIGSFTEIARSYIGNKVFLHRNYVGDSVLDDKVMMGAGANTANLRFDGKSIMSYVGDKKVDTYFYKLGAIIGKNSKIGVGSVIYPGVKIGKNSWIAPHEKVKKDIPDYIYFSENNEKNNIKV